MTLLTKPRRPIRRKVRPRFFCGLDVAQMNDYSALAIFQRTFTNEEHLDRETQVRYDLVFLERWKVRYPELLEKLGKVFSTPELGGWGVLATDATGPGLPFYEDLRRDTVLRESVQEISPVVITGGQNTTRAGDFWHVPKTHLITPLQTTFQRQEVKIPRGLAYLDTLREELRDYEMKVTANRNITYSNNPREGGAQHDDLILAAALAYWKMTHKQPRRSLRVVR